MIKNFFITIQFVFATVLIGYSQYNSGITTPDKSQPMVKDDSDPSFRLASSISSAKLRDHMKVLASDSLEGRETGKKGIQLAADYISKNLRNLGLYAKDARAGYFQPVAFTYSKWIDTDMYINGTRYRLLWDYLALPELNENKEFIKDKEVIFLGYGIDDSKYSDFKKVDVKDKIIMINKGEPWDKNGNSYITGTKDTSAWSKDINMKLKAAKDKGAKLVLIIEDDIKRKVEDNRNKLLGANLQLGNLKNKILNTANHVYISSTIAKQIIGENDKKILKARKKLEKGKPANVKLSTDFVMNMAKDVNVLEGNNIVAYVEGKSKKDEFIIVTAHYDHLGKRGDEVFNGADDNASGTSTLLELAKAFQGAVLEGSRPERSIVFAWFCGEEKGLLGSEYYSENPIFPLENTIANVNIDMVGRVNDKYKDNPDYIYVIGSDRLSSDLHKINESVNQKYTQLTLDYTYNGENDPNKFYYRSDHYNFAKKGIPAIFYFNGTHEDYHRTTDDIEKINFDKMAHVGQLIFHTIWELANRPDRIVVDGEVK
ncbi:MAG: M28 family peptidase [Saprospiraceae bacterium]